jgi:threonine dehydratase
MSGSYTLELPSLQSIVAAAKAIASFVLRTPLLRLRHAGKRRVYLKLESLQPIGSFKIRCGANALQARGYGRDAVVTTASAGNEAGTPVAADAPVRVPFNPRTFITGMGSSQV